MISSPPSRNLPSEPRVVAINEEGHILRYDHRYVKHTISKQEKELPEAADISTASR